MHSARFSTVLSCNLLRQTKRLKLRKGSSSRLSFRATRGARRTGEIRDRKKFLRTTNKKKKGNRLEIDRQKGGREGRALTSDSGLAAAEVSSSAPPPRAWREPTSTSTSAPPVVMSGGAVESRAAMGLV